MHYSYHFIALHDLGGAPLYASSRKYDLADWLRRYCIDNGRDANHVTVWRIRDGVPDSGYILTDKDLFGD